MMQNDGCALLMFVKGKHLYDVSMQEKYWEIALQHPSLHPSPAAGISKSA